jgi:hypothetical protein
MLRVVSTSNTGDVFSWPARTTSSLLLLSPFPLWFLFGCLLELDLCPFVLDIPSAGLLDTLAFAGLLRRALFGTFGGLPSCAFPEPLDIDMDRIGVLARRSLLGFRLGEIARAEVAFADAAMRSDP